MEDKKHSEHASSASRERSRSRDGNRAGSPSEAPSQTSDVARTGTVVEAPNETQGHGVVDAPSCSEVAVAAAPDTTDGQESSRKDLEPFLPTLPLGPPAVPPLPQAPLPERTRVIVTVPVIVRMHVDQKLSDLRAQLLSGGCHVQNGSFHVRGGPEALDESMQVSDLPDMRLIINPDCKLQPWQLCLAHRRQKHEAPAQIPGALPFGSALAQNPYYKTRMCIAWAKNSSCAKEGRCVYAHGPSELRASVVGAFLPRLPSQFPLGWRPGMPISPAFQPVLQGGPPRPVLPGPAVNRLSTPVAIVRPAVPQRVFTVDEAEEKRRAERALRFAPRQASFMFEEKEDEQQSGDAAAADKLGTEAALETSFAAESEALESADAPVSEDQISDYLNQMQQDFMGSLMSMEQEGTFQIPAGLPMPVFPPTMAGLPMPEFPPALMPAVVHDVAPDENSATAAKSEGSPLLPSEASTRAEAECSLQSIVSDPDI